MEHAISPRLCINELPPPLEQFGVPIYPLPADRQVLSGPLTNVEPTITEFSLDRDPMLTSVSQVAVHGHLSATRGVEFPANRAPLSVERRVSAYL
jgi:hypothetical protein